MIKSIKLKLWITLFVALLISLGSLLALTYLSVKQRFLDYATSQILERLEPLEQSIIDVYISADSLYPFTETPSRWNQLRDASYRQYLRDQNRRAALVQRRADWSEREILEEQLQPDQRAFFQHLVLFDQQRQLVAGRLKEDARYVLRELPYENQIIAHIGYIRPKAFLRSVDKLFLDQQIRSFGTLSIVMVFAALLVTLIVSRWLVKPMSLLASSAKRVAAGDFSVRVGLAGDDELGTLCQDFDEMARSLEHNEITRRQWVADISHEMRTPLSVLKAQIEAMQDGIRSLDSDSLQLLKRNVDSLSGIIDDLYELSLADLGELTLYKTSFSAVDLWQAQLAEFAAKLESKHLDASFNCPDGQLAMYADEKRLRQLIVNLLENSYRYTDSPGRIHVTLTKDNGTIIMEIEDSSPAVPESALPHIFDRLYRLESSRNRETGGAGLGLSICKSIVEAHEGSIVASLSALGGLKQTIRIPEKT